MQDNEGIEVAELQGEEAHSAWAEAVEKAPATPASRLELVPIDEREEQRVQRLLSTPYALSLKNEAERRCVEAERVRADLRIKRMKESGELLRRQADREIEQELNSRVTNNLGFYA